MARGNGRPPGAPPDPNCCSNAQDGEECGDPEVVCACRAAVTRAYDGMLDSGVPDSVALEAAIRVYRYHHPQGPDEEAVRTVEAWVMRGPVH